MTRLTMHRGGLIAFVLCAVCALAAPAFADAPSAVPGSTRGSVVVNPDGTRTVSVQGSWAWPSQTTDCNLTRAGAGFAVDWADPAQPGNDVVTLNGQDIAVGVAAAGALNPADDLVHATPPATDSTSTSLWRSGCGTFATPPGYNTGTWGPVSHTYPASFTGAITVCPLFYDVQGTASGGPSSATEITPSGTSDNEDDSAEDNGSTPRGNECPQTTIKSSPSVSLAAPSGTVGSSAAATGTLSAGYAPSGTLSFAVYGPADRTCTAAPVFSGSATVSGDGAYASPAFDPAQVGTYEWVVSYGGDAANQAASSPCGDAPETVAPAPSPPPTPDPQTTTTQSPTPAPASGRGPAAPTATLDLNAPPTGLGALPLGPALPRVRPALGRTLALAPASGTVLVNLPGSHGARPLRAGESVPVGTTIDARNGVVLLASARDAAGDPQFATAGGGVFQVLQTRSSGMTEMVLRTHRLARLCAVSDPSHRSSGPAVADAARAARKRSRRRVVNLLWSNDNHGQFSTRGQESVALVRGTSWVTAETCDGTLTGVMHGRVVVHDHHSGRVVVLNAGESYLARR